MPVPDVDVTALDTPIDVPLSLVDSADVPLDETDILSVGVSVVQTSDNHCNTDVAVLTVPDAPEVDDDITPLVPCTDDCSDEDAPNEPVVCSPVVVDVAVTSELLVDNSVNNVDNVAVSLCAVESVPGDVDEPVSPIVVDESTADSVELDDS